MIIIYPHMAIKRIPSHSDALKTPTKLASRPIRTYFSWLIYTILVMNVLEPLLQAII